MSSYTSRSIVLARHGRTVLNAAGQLRGHLDPPLDPVGEREVRDLAAALVEHLDPDRPERIFTSPLLRARQTAHAIAERMGIQVEVDERLIDRDYGVWAGQRREDVVAQWGSLDSAPGVERATDVVARVRSALEDHHADPGTGPLVLVSHDAVNRLLLTALDPALGPPDDLGQRTACWNVLRSVGGGWRVDLVDQKAIQQPGTAAVGRRSGW